MPAAGASFTPATAGGFNPVLGFGDPYTAINSFGDYRYVVPTPPTPGSVNVSLPGAFSNYQQNPLYQLAQQGANIGGYQTQMGNIAGQLQNAFTGNLDFANQALNLAFDPQQALFKQRQQDLIDATRAGEAARGISMTPFGAAIESDQVARFFNQWQDEQVQRMATGASAATALQGMWAEAQQAAAGIWNDEIKNQLQEYGLKGDMIDKAMNEVLTGLQIQTQAAIASLQAQSGGGGGGGGRSGGARGGGLGMSAEGPGTGGVGQGAVAQGLAGGMGGSEGGIS